MGTITSRAITIPQSSTAGPAYTVRSGRARGRSANDQPRLDRFCRSDSTADRYICPPAPSLDEAQESPVLPPPTRPGPILARPRRCRIASRRMRPHHLRALLALLLQLAAPGRPALAADTTA